MGSAAFAVTTRSRLKGVRFFPSMMLASLRVRRQLQQTPGCVRFGSIVASPREFWTITVWASRDDMLNFMRSGAHEDIMWLFGTWLKSFWLMRWSPTTMETGSWGADPLGVPPEPDEPTESAQPEQRQALDAALDALPRLKASVRSDGKAAYEASPIVRRSRKAVSGGAAVIARLRVDRRYQIPSAWRDLRRLQRHVRQDDGVLRWAQGFGKPRELFLLLVMSDEAAAEAALSDPLQQRLQDRWGDGYWAMAWEAANEFGHWDGFRLRQERSRAAVQPPEHAKHLDT